MGVDATGKKTISGLPVGYQSRIRNGEHVESTRSHVNAYLASCPKTLPVVELDLDHGATGMRTYMAALDSGLPMSDEGYESGDGEKRWYMADDPDDPRWHAYKDQGNHVDVLPLWCWQTFGPGSWHAPAGKVYAAKRVPDIAGMPRITFDQLVETGLIVEKSKPKPSHGPRRLVARTSRIPFSPAVERHLAASGRNDSKVQVVRGRMRALDTRNDRRVLTGRLAKELPKHRYFAHAYTAAGCSADQGLRARKSSGYDWFAMQHMVESGVDPVKLLNSTDRKHVRADKVQRLHGCPKFERIGKSKKGRNAAWEWLGALVGVTGRRARQLMSVIVDEGSLAVLERLETLKAKVEESITRLKTLVGKKVARGVTQAQHTFFTWADEYTVVDTGTGEILSGIPPPSAASG